MQDCQARLRRHAHHDHLDVGIICERWARNVVLATRCLSQAVAYLRLRDRKRRQDIQRQGRGLAVTGPFAHCALERPGQIGAMPAEGDRRVEGGGTQSSL